MRWTSCCMPFDAAKSPPSASRGGQTLARPGWLPTGRIPLREPPCPDRQVGEGECPALDAVRLLRRGAAEVKTRHQPSAPRGADADQFVEEGGDGCACEGSSVLFYSQPRLVQCCKVAVT